MSRTIVTAAFSACLLAACGDQPLEVAGDRDADQNAIYGGQFAQDAHHTSVVAIASSFRPKQNIFCTGTLIADDIVLTAAHCLDEAGFFSATFNPLEPGDLVVGFGYSKQSLNFEAVDYLEINPGYDRTQLGVNDIALIRLVDPAPTGFDPIPALPFSLALDPVADVGEPVNFAGFGLNDLVGIPYGSKLEVDGTIDAVNAITVEYEQFAGGPCGGDSGGPMFIDRAGDWYVAGVTSWGSANCDGFGAFGVSTTPDVYESWIAAF